MTSVLVRFTYLMGLFTIFVLLLTFYNISDNNDGAECNSASFNLDRDNLLKMPMHPDWQNVTGSPTKFYAYSAYYDIPMHLIRVIGATLTQSSEKVHCRFYNGNGAYYKTTAGVVQAIQENGDMIYSACFVLCILTPGENLPFYISVLSGASEFKINSELNVLRVQYLDLDYKKMDFAVCVKPIHSKYNNTLQFLEFMEFYKLMGVKHFIFFNASLDESVGCLLRQYQADVTVLPWKLPQFMISEKEIRTQGIFAALNDCIYRYRGIANYVVMLDLDEFIVPQHADNFKELLQQADAASVNKNIGAYSFVNGFYYLQLINEPSDAEDYGLSHYPLAENVSKHLNSLQKFKRKSKFNPHRERSKYICNPEKVVEAGNHFLWEMMPGYTTALVQSSLAFSHHYRICDFGKKECNVVATTVDKSVVRFGRNLAVKVAKHIEAYNTNSCPINLPSII